MDATKLLKTQHDEVKSMFKLFERTESEQERLNIFNAIADALAVHATIEEKIFYPAVKAKQTEDLLRESLEEHLSAKRIIADAMQTPPSDPQFKAKVTTLQEQILHHVKEEESDMFPEVRRLFGAEELERLGLEMENMAAELMGESDEPRAAIPTETDEPAPLE